MIIIATAQNCAVISFRSDLMKRSVSLETLKLIFLLAYFPILTVERIINLFVTFFGDFSAYTSLDYYMLGLSLLSLAATYIFLTVECRTFLFRRKGRKRSLEMLTTRRNYRMLSAAAGILLAGSMVHSEGSVPLLRYIGYGCIIASMAAHTMLNVKKDGNADRKWLSFAYLAAYLLSVPVVYHTQIEHARLFIPIEIVVSLGLTILFTIMLLDFYSGNVEYSFSALPFLVAVFGDALVISMRWYEEINVAVLISVCVATVLWFTGSVLGAAPVKTKK